MIRKTCFVMLMILAVLGLHAQELQVKVSVNHSQVQGTDDSVFENLQQTIEQFMNERAWTDLQFLPNERIQCRLNLTVNKYLRDENHFECTALIQANRPVFNADYTTTLYNNRDASFNFDFQQFDQLNFAEENIDNQLTALLAYYALLMIGMDLDSFSPMGGTDVLQRCLVLVNNAQNLGFPGWKSFEDNRNRFAIINDYMDEAMKPFRQLQYDFYRKGLDEMANNPERGRTEISDALENDLQQAHVNKPLSLLPQIWTDYKKDELSSIYQGKGTQKEKQRIYDLLMGLNAAQNNNWELITK